jgi:hypothetical protein
MFPILFLVIVWDQGWVSRIGMGIFLAMSLYSLFLHLFSTKVTLSLSGILTANMIKVKLGVFKIKGKNIFIEWSEIKSICFKNYLAGASWVKNPRLFLVIRTRSNKKYLYIVHDIPNFLQALKRLNKDYLLKDKKRLYEKYGIK